MIGYLDSRAIRQPAILLILAILFALLIYQFNSLGLLLFLPPVLVAGAVGLAFARYPWTTFALLVMTVPFQRFGSEGTMLPVTLTQLVFPVAVAGCLIALFAERRPARGHMTLLPYTLVIAVMVASSFQAASASAAWAEIARWVVALAAFWIALQLIVGSSGRRLVVIVAVIAAGGVFEATVGVVQSVVGFGPFELSSGVSRAYGTFGRPNSYAGYLEMTLFPAVAMTIWYLGQTAERLKVYSADRLQGMTASRESRAALFRAVLATVLFGGASAIVLTGIVASLSRGAWVGVAVGAGITALLLGPKTRLVVVTASLAIAALILSGQTGVLPEDLRERVAESVEEFGTTDVRAVPVTDENFAAIERLAHWQTGLNMYREHPMLGIGVGNFNKRFEEFSIREDFRRSQGHAHNYYIHTLAETGLAGLLVYLTLLGSVVAIALRVLLARSAGGTLARYIVLGAFGSIVAVATHNVFENLHVLNLGIVISLLWALVIAGHERWRAEEFRTA